MVSAHSICSDEVFQLYVGLTASAGGWSCEFHMREAVCVYIMDILWYGPVHLLVLLCMKSLFWARHGCWDERMFDPF